ncbi:MAG TPA: efflux RND transporter periplasmic adaptor subunit [Anaerolineales bacterium]|nr:efflux RND transporter periplasmic adaptor subunit [Anaerolineales bacterium]
MKKKILISLFSLVAALSVLLAGCGSTSSLVTPTPYPTAERKSYTVARGDIVINVELFGQVQPRTLKTVYFQMDGHVGDVFVQVNDHVKKGDLLANLVELNDLLISATSTQDAIQRAEDNLKIAQLTLEKYKATGASPYDIQIQALNIDLAQLDYNEALVKYGIDPKSPDPFGQLQAQVDKARVYAPLDGIIISGVNPGRSVTDTTPAFAIGDGTQMEIVANVDASKADDEFKSMYEGMPVTVLPNDKPDLKWTGKITQLPSPYGTGDQNDKTVHITLDTAPATSDFKSGDTVTVDVQLANKIGILWLPPDAIRTVGGRTFVIINGDNGPKRVDVEIGLKTTDKIEIISGLTEGQVVVGP